MFYNKMNTNWYKASQSSNDNDISSIWDIPVPEGMKAFEEAHVGGIADLGNPDAKQDVVWIEGYDEAITPVREALRRQFGDYITMYRSMSRDQLRAWRNGEDVGNMSGTLSIRQARGFSSLAAVKDKDRVVVTFKVQPEDIIMRGSMNEGELVFDGNSVSADTVKEID
jgi:hypothetical protein